MRSDVAKRVERRMKELQSAFPPSLIWSVPFDTTKFVSAAIHEVYKTLIEAAVLVLVVILVFLQDWRADLGAGDHRSRDHHRRLCGDGGVRFSVNLTTLFAIILAIGIVVDDAIVVVEGARKAHRARPHAARRHGQGHA